MVYSPLVVVLLLAVLLVRLVVVLVVLVLVNGYHDKIDYSSSVDTIYVILPELTRYIN